MDTCNRTTFNETNLYEPDDTQQEELCSIPNLLTLTFTENDSGKIDMNSPETQMAANKPKSQIQQEISQQTTLIQRVVVPRADFIKQNPHQPADLSVFPIQHYPLGESIASTTESTQEYPTYKGVKQEKLLDTISYIFLDDENLEEIEHYTRESQTNSLNPRPHTKVSSQSSGVGLSSKIGLASMMFAGGFAVGGISSWVVLSDQFASANTKLQKTVQKYANLNPAYSTNALEKINISTPEIDLPETSFKAVEPSEDIESQVTSQPAKNQASLNQVKPLLSKSIKPEAKTNSQLTNNQVSLNQVEPPLPTSIDLEITLQPAKQQPTLNQTESPLPNSQVLAATSKPLFQQRLLTSADLKGLSAQELTFMRNEIYARHGRRFKEQKLQRYFESQSWYKPRYAPGEFPDSVLSQIELKNAIMIREYQRIHGMTLNP
ncbi:YARHG domain-containing protein [Fischerella thermalis]|uniref:YARHG domain-containing protein n=1 Tax=Fischerella thermalis TaxID=372787 RepID=UPI0015E13DA4|nr:YARHG domain-containing protein [Fischerella thermalis]MBF1990457.1 YARHG domain-containing protein [Fischerella thermalis M58_A2018_009]MBF2061921.1 YARHG domain-containing protein [Fischerella thermalis M66_A2018_004]MBF2070575.1 YARHG domain-containing protein [Fischerella thermalis M48_A2018_028]